MVRKWSPECWREFPILQQPNWPDVTALDKVESRLKDSPPLVFAGEARNLRNRLAEACERLEKWLQ